MQDMSFIYGDNWLFNDWYTKSLSRKLIRALSHNSKKNKCKTIEGYKREIVFFVKLHPWFKSFKRLAIDQDKLSLNNYLIMKIMMLSCFIFDSSCLRSKNCLKVIPASKNKWRMYEQSKLESLAQVMIPMHECWSHSDAKLASRKQREFPIDV